MAAPWAVACTRDWAALRSFFRRDLRAHTREPGPVPPAPRYALLVLALTVAGFVVTSAFDVAPAWAALGGVLLLGVPRSIRRQSTPLIVLLEANPGFCLFVLALGVIVEAATGGIVHRVLTDLVPGGESLSALVGLALCAAVLANLVNNLPATLTLLPIVVHSHLAVLAMLVEVSVGPNLAFTGSLATLLWRRRLPEEVRPSASEFHRLGAVSALPIVAIVTVVMWSAARVVGL